MNPLTPVLALLALLVPQARADAPLSDAQQAELDRARAEIANQIQLSAYDLIDELVYAWTKEPVFEKPTAVVLASVTVPVGLGSGMQALMENHLAGVLTQNPTTNVKLVHCPQCTAVVVHSGPEGTVVSRGIDNPSTLAELGATTGEHALFVDIEAEGTFLVLRARLTELSEEMPIVWSHTLSTSASTPALLRQAADLKSAQEARQEYIDALRDRGPITIPARFVIRSYSRSDNEQNLAPPPFVWLQTGIELSSTAAHRWTGSVIAGYSFVPQAYQGLMLQGRINRLLTGRSRSYTRPDLYVFVGAAAITVWGAATAPFQDQRLTADDLIVLLEGDDPRTTFGGLHVGLDLRLGNRIGAAWFLETLPSLNDSRNLGQYTSVAGVPFPSMGTEVTFWF